MGPGCFSLESDPVTVNRKGVAAIISLSLCVELPQPKHVKLSHNWWLQIGGFPREILLYVIEQNQKAGDFGLAVLCVCGSRDKDEEPNNSTTHKIVKAIN